MVCINLLLGVTQWTVRGSKPGKDENFLIRPDWPRGRPASCTMGRGGVCFLGVWRPGTGGRAAREWH